jgi:hypothetical protein
VQLPVRFNANLSVARSVAYDPGDCAALAGENTVQDAIHRLCQLLGTMRPGIRVRRVGLLGGAPFQNDVLILPDDLTRGVVFECDQPLAVASVNDKPVVELLAFLPHALIVNEGAWPVGIPMSLDGRASLSGGTRLQWVPTTPVITWLRQQVEALARINRDRLLVRLRLLGAYVWAAEDPSLHIDGQLFGRPDGAVPRPRSFADLPSGNGAGGSDLEMWLWVGRTREEAVPALPGGPGGLDIVPPGGPGGLVIGPRPVGRKAPARPRAKPATAPAKKPRRKPG